MLRLLRLLPGSCSIVSRVKTGSSVCFFAPKKRGVIIQIALPSFPPEIWVCVCKYQVRKRPAGHVLGGTKKDVQWG